MRPLLVELLGCLQVILDHIKFRRRYPGTQHDDQATKDGDPDREYPQCTIERTLTGVAELAGV